MRRFSEGQMPLEEFLGGVLAQLRQIVDLGRALGVLKVPGSRQCPAPSCTGALRRRKGKNGYFWSCTRYPQCRHTEDDPRSAHRRAGARKPPSASV
jgi:DNA topoisomerase-3